MAREYDLNDENGREQFALKACAFVGTLQPVEQERYYKLIAQKTGYELESLREQGKRGEGYTEKPLRFSRGTYRRRSAQDEDQKELLLRTMLTCAVKDKRAYAALKAAGAGETLTEPYAALFAALDQPGFSFAAYVGVQEKQVAEKLTALIRDEQNMVEPEKTALDCLKRLRQLDREDRLSELQRELKRTDLSDGERAALLKRITDMIRAKK